MKRLLLLVTLAVNVLIGALAPVASAQSLPTLGISNTSAVEGDTGAVKAVFTVTLSAPSTQTVTVNYATTSTIGTNSALAGSDYTATSGTLTFAPGITQQTISVAVIGDTRDELDEVFFINLTRPTNAVLADSQGSGTIQNDDRKVFINNVSVQEGDSGTTPLIFTLTLSTASSHVVTVDYLTVSCTAEKRDYLAAAGTVTFNPGDTRRTITVSVIGDTLNESNEVFRVQLTPHHAVEAVVKFGSGFGTILDDDPIKIADQERC